MNQIRLGDRVRFLRRGADYFSVGIVMDIMEAPMFIGSSVFAVWVDDANPALVEIPLVNGCYTVIERPEPLEAAVSVFEAQQRYMETKDCEDLRGVGAAEQNIG